MFPILSVSGDSVQCAFCLGIIGAWEPEDVPLSEHRRHFPRCPFALGFPVGNIPLDPLTGQEILPAEMRADEGHFRVEGSFDVTGIRPSEFRSTAEPERGYPSE
jgi:hypothetical protein